jgi:hypothetical protein
MGLYNKKDGKGLQVKSLPGGDTWYRKGQDFILSHLYIILSLEVGRKSVSLPVSNGLRLRGRSWMESCIHLC